MTELLNPEPNDNVLEIGTGCGYQAAILANLVKKVTTIERISVVADLARSNLKALGISNVEIITTDGTLGYPENSPYNGIIITAATPSVPEPLIEQLAENGRLVAPVGGREIQELVVLSRHGSVISQELHGGVRFVPLIGEHGWDGDRDS
jgi:protein-L-isoaspartate(D-aspartate) O-methyltransferase